MNNKLDEVLIYGMTKQPTKIVWNGQDLASSKWTYDTNTNVLTMTKLALDLSKTHKFVLL
jgi:hypothetical protein